MEQISTPKTQLSLTLTYIQIVYFPRLDIVALYLLHFLKTRKNATFCSASPHYQVFGLKGLGNFLEVVEKGEIYLAKRGIGPGHTRTRGI
jgi:hypothetical protein